MDTARTTIVYIDGFNLYYRLKYIPRCKWLDLKRLCDLCLETSKHKITKIKYFTALVKENLNDPSNVIRQQVFLRALSTIPNLDIVYGQFKKRQVKGRLFNNNKGIRNEIVTVEKWEEKETDVNIATHLIEDAYLNKKEYKCAVLLSNDTDLKTPLLRVKKTKKLVGVISPYKTVHTDLIRSSHFRKVISDSILQNCQFPKEMQDSTGKFFCSTKWLL